LVRSQLTSLVYGDPVWSNMSSYWKEYNVEQPTLSCPTTKLDYKSRLVQLNLFPLMYWYELTDIMFLVKCLKNPKARLNISEYVVFSSTKIRPASYFKLTCYYSRTNLSRHFYFNMYRVFRLWNALPLIDLNLSSDILKMKIKSFLWSFFKKHFNPHIPILFISCAHVPDVSLPLPTSYSCL